MISTLTTKQAWRVWFPFETRKLLISILLGLAGFSGSFFPLSFSDPPFTLTITWWYFLPFLAGLAYGGRYGFIAGTLGLGGLFPFLLWPTNGWANFVVSGLLIGWYTWQGYFEGVRRKKPIFWNHPLFISLPYAFIYGVAMRLLYPIAFSFNPPAWSPQAELTMPLPILDGIIIKGILLTFVCLLFAVFILRTPLAQRMFEQEVKAETRYNTWIVLWSFVGAISAWGMFILFNRIFVDKTFPQLFFQFNDPHEVIALMVCLAVGFFIGLMITQFMETFLRTEDQFNASLDEFRLLAENSTDMISRHDPQGLYLYASPACRVLLGYAPEELLGHSAFEFVHPDDIQPVDQSRLNILARPIISTTEFRGRQKSGAYIWLETTSRTIVDPRTGAVSEIHAATRDISARKQAEQALLESEARYRLIADHTADVIWIMDVETRRFKYISPSVVKLRGYTPEEVMAQPVSAALTPESALKVEALMSTHIPRFLANPSLPFSLTSEVDQPHRDGSIVHTEVTTTYVMSDQGKLEIVGVSRNITERKKAEAALRDGEQKFSAAFQSSPAAVAIATLDGKYVEVNLALCEMLGYAREEILGRTVFELGLMSEPERLKLATLLQQNGGALKNTEVKFRIRDGQVRDILLSVQAIELHGVPHRLATAIDITERKRADEALRESEKKYRLLFENMTSGFAVHQMLYDEKGEPCDYRYLEINPAFEKLTGFPGAGMLGRTIRELMPDTEEYWIQVFGKVARTGEPIAYMNFSRSLGKYYDTYVFSPERDKFAVVFNDVTERVEAEMALRRAGDRAQNYLDTVEAILVALDVNGQIVLINRKGCRLLGYTEKELLGASWFETCLPGPDNEVSQPEFKKMMTGETGVLEYHESAIVTRAGALRQIAWHNTLLHDEQGGISGMLSAGEDVTERLQAERQLTEQLAELRRWQQVTLGREVRLLELKREINALLVQAGQLPRYPGAEIEE